MMGENRTTLSVCRDFYEQYGRKMIHDNFPAYESRIAVGLVGEGSECFGFDDEISRDHDFGLGFCLWLGQKDYQEIGQKLSEAYQDLIVREGVRFAVNAWGESVSQYTPRLDQRRGVMKIDEFYGGILKLRPDLGMILDKHYWMYAEERWIATAVNGQVFRDDEGTFSKVRQEILNYYPKKVFMLKLAEQLHLFSHGGQSNYPRMMARGDSVTASLCINQTVMAAMSIAYMLNRKYAPYYKWMRKGIDAMNLLPGLTPLLDQLISLPGQKKAWEGYRYSATAINKKDEVIRTVEEIAGLLLEEMNRQGIIRGKERFLESYVPGIVESVKR